MTVPQTVINNRYRIIDQIGSGGMGAVLLVEDRLSGEQVALKQVKIPAEKLNFSASDTSRNQYLALAIEFQMLASLRHPHIITVLDYGFDDNGQPFFTMEYLPSAKTITQYGNNVTFDDRIRIIAETLEALAYLHRRNIIHRDLKPGNVLVDSNHKVQMLDFGLAMTVEPNQDTENQEGIAGTMAYMAPELFGDIPATVQSDIYAIGTMAYEIFAGQHPYDIKNITMLIVQIMSKLPDDDLLDDRVRDVIMNWLDKDPNERPNNARNAMRLLYEAIDRVLPPESETIRESFIQASRFVGRETELVQLKASLDQLTKQDKASFWLIGGESGAGKSRLVEEIRIRAVVDGVAVVRGQAASDGSLSYQVWRNIMRPLLLATDLSDLEASIISEIIPDASRLLEKDITSAPILDGKANQERLALTIADIIRRQPKPLMLIFEDLHWADDSLSILNTQLRLLQQSNVMIIGTYRNDEMPDLPETLPTMQRITLERFSQGDIANLSASMLGDIKGRTQLVDFLSKETEGNVFFLVEVMRALAEETGRLDDIVTMTLPHRVIAGGIQDIIQRRLSRMPDWTQPILQLTAVAGRQIDEKILTQAEPSADIDAFITAGTNAVVFDNADGNWRFAHDKLREALLASLDEQTQKSLHRKVAQAIETIYPDRKEYNEVLAVHWDNAGDAAKAVPYMISAATYLIDTVADFQRGDVLATRALELNRQLDKPNPLHDSELHYVKGKLEIKRSNYTVAKDHFNQSLNSIYDDLVRQAWAHLGLSDVARNLGHMDTARSQAQKGLDMARSGQNRHAEAVALTRLAKVSQFEGEIEAARTLFEESLAIDRVLYDDFGIATNINDIGITYAQMGDLTKAKDYFEQALDMQRKIGNRQEIATALINLGFAAYLEADYTLAETYLTESTQIGREIGYSEIVADALVNLAMVSSAKSDFDQAIQYYDEAIPIHRDAQYQWGLVVAIIHQSHSYFELKQFNKVEANLAEVLAISKSTNILPLQLSCIILAARLYLQRGQKDQALTLVAIAEQNPATPEEDKDLYLTAIRQALGDEQQPDIEISDIAQIIDNLMKEFPETSKQ